ncbi:MAG: sensor histidine kinase [Gemmatimonadota bacterium]
MGHPTVDLTALSRELKSAAAEITEEWLERLARDPVAMDRSLPVEELRDHVPEMLEAVADCVETGRPGPPEGQLDTFRRLGRLRLERGDDIQDLLGELALLADVVFARTAAWVRDADLDAAAALDVARQLSGVFQHVAMVAVRTDRDRRRDREQAVVDFARMIGHELASPLNAAVVGADLLEEPAVAASPERRAQQLERVRGSLARIQRLVDDIRSVTLTGEADEPPAEPVPLRTVLEQVFRHLEAAAERRQVRLELGEPFHDVEIDRAGVEIPVMNLVSNAIKYADPEAADRWVRVTAAPDPDHPDDGVCIAVADNGVGIPEPARSRIFERFYRADRSVEGTGLGLAITRRMVEARRGRIWFESKPGRGTTFYLALRTGADG